MIYRLWIEFDFYSLKTNKSLNLNKKKLLLFNSKLAVFLWCSYGF